MQRDKLVEELARVISTCTVISLEPSDDAVLRATARTAERILSRLDELGLCIVPREPTEAMQHAGLDAMVRWIEGRLGPLPELPPADENGIVHLTERENIRHSMHCGMLMRNSLEVTAAYRAMLNAASKQ